jgi:hypothetical protein
MDFLPSSTTTTRDSFNQKNPDEVNLLEYLYAIVKHKMFIVGFSVFGFFFGFVTSQIQGPTWVAEAVIAPKERDSQKSTPLADLGGLGGLVAGQINLDGGNVSMNKMDVILDSRTFGAKLIEKYSLLPAIYKYQWPKKYEKYWDPVQNRWKPTFVAPDPLAVGNYIKKKYLEKTINLKKNTLVLKIQSQDSSFTINLASAYIDYLNEYIKTKIQTKARENAEYLDTQLAGTADPLLRGKILELVANEIDKKMLVSREAFEVVDPIYFHRSNKRKALYPISFAFALFFLSSLFFVLMHAFASSEKTEEDQYLIKKIITEMRLLPGAADKKNDG